MMLNTPGFSTCARLRVLQKKTRSAGVMPASRRYSRQRVNCSGSKSPVSRAEMSSLTNSTGSNCTGPIGTGAGAGCALAGATGAATFLTSLGGCWGAATGAVGATGAGVAASGVTDTGTDTTGAAATGFTSTGSSSGSNSARMGPMTWTGTVAGFGAAGVGWARMMGTEGGFTGAGGGGGARPGTCSTGSQVWKPSRQTRSAASTLRAAINSRSSSSDTGPTRLLRSLV